jgi:hypothetical protein
MQKTKRVTRWAETGPGKAQAGRPRLIGLVSSDDGSGPPFFSIKYVEP